MNDAFKTSLRRAGAVAALTAWTFAVPALAQRAPEAPARPDRDMARVLEAFEALDPKPIETLTPEEARKQPSIGDAAKAVAQSQGERTIPDDGVTTQDIAIPGPTGEIPARVYTPAGPGPFPVVVFYHGGGWVIAGLDAYDASTRGIAKEANAIVVSSHYRQGPEHKFPAAHDDAFAAYDWVVNNVQTLRGDKARVAVAGESAGGNLAAAVSIMARDKKVQAPVHQVLIYPIAGSDPDTVSRRRNVEAKPLNTAAVEWFAKYALNPEDLKNPLINLVEADLRGLPDATVITAEIDPLRSEGQRLAERLRAAGSKVTTRDYEGVTHEFFGMAAVVDDAKFAQEVVGLQLRAAFGEAPTGATGRPRQ